MSVAPMRISMMNRRLVCANPVFPAEKASFAQKYQAKRTHRLQQYVTYARQLIPIIAKNKRKKALSFFYEMARCLHLYEVVSQTMAPANLRRRNLTECDIKVI